MGNKVERKWDAAEGSAEVSIKYKDYQFLGAAMCHPDDTDMMSEKTGMMYAETRALLNLLEYQRDCEIKPALAALKQLYYSMNRSKNYNQKSYEARMLYRQIRQKEEELDFVRKEIKSNRAWLYQTIKEKDEFYAKVRKSRQ